MKKSGKYTIISLLLIAVLIATGVFATNSVALAKGKIKSKSVSVNISEVTIAVGDIVVISARMTPTNSTDSISWSSSAKSVSTVSKNGVVTGKKAGTAKITAKTTSNKKAVCTVKVKEYLTKEETLALIKTNTLSEESIKAIIENNTLSEEDVIALIQDKTLSEETIVSLIDSKAITEEEIINIVTNNSLSEADVKAIIESNILSQDDIIALINNNTLSQEDINALIDEKVISESEIQKLISDGISAAQDFNDGDELALWSHQQFPISNEYITLNNATIKKYHCDEWSGTPQKIRYEITFEGKITGSYRPTDFLNIYLKYMPQYGQYDGRYYPFKVRKINELSDEKNTLIEYGDCSIDENGNFTLKVTQYDIMINACEFCISDMNLENDFWDSGEDSSGGDEEEHPGESW